LIFRTSQNAQRRLARKKDAAEQRQANGA